jgi:hypothetical protein
MLSILFVIIYIRIRAFTKAKTSFGQYVMGYMVVARDEKRTYRIGLKRFGWSTIYFSLWPAYLIYKKLKKLDKDIWDQKVGTESKKFTYN